MTQFCNVTIRVHLGNEWFINTEDTFLANRLERVQTAMDSSTHKPGTSGKLGLVQDLGLKDHLLNYFHNFTDNALACKVLL